MNNLKEVIQDRKLTTKQEQKTYYIKAQPTTESEGLYAIAVYPLCNIFRTKRLTPYDENLQ